MSGTARQRREPSADLVEARQKSDTVIVRRKPYEKPNRIDPGAAIHRVAPKKRQGLHAKDRVPTAKTEVIVDADGTRRITNLRKVRVSASNDGTFINYSNRTKTGALIEEGKVTDMPYVCGVYQGSHGSSRPNRDFGAYRDGRNDDGEALSPHDGGQFYTRTLFFQAEDGSEIDLESVQIVRAGRKDEIRRRVRVKKP
jgi:hypothetical protein